MNGTVMPCIGPLAGFSVTIIVDITDADGQRVARRVLHASGSAALSPVPFSFTLPVGRYTASSPADGAQQVRVTSGKSSAVTLVNSCI